MTLVFVHGYNLDSPDWKEIVIGDDHLKNGRLTTGLKVALENNARLILGSGGSEKDGLKESEFAKRYLEKNMHIFQYLSLNQNVMLPVDLEKWIDDNIFLDTESKNTREEIETLYKQTIKHNYRTVYIVSSPAHIPRCMKILCEVFQTSERTGHYDLYGVPSETSWADPQKVVVFEPSHKGNGVDWSFLNEIWKVKEIDRPDMARELNLIIEKYIGKCATDEEIGMYILNHFRIADSS